MDAETTKGFYYLIRIIYNVSDSKDEKIVILPFSFVHSGDYVSGKMSAQGFAGFQWTLTARNSSIGYRFDYNKGRLAFHGADNYKYYGFSLR